MSGAPPWAVPGVTDVPAARAFLAALRAEDTLVISSNDADRGYTASAFGRRLRGHGVTVATNLVVATPPTSELSALHRSFGLGAARYFAPRTPTAAATLAELVLGDAALVARIRADRTLTKILVSFKTAHALRLAEALRLEPVFCDPAPAAYEAANDKRGLAAAGARHGFATLDAVAVDDDAALAAAFPTLAARYGAGCIVRATRGAGGRDIHRARTLRAARRIRQRLAGAGRDVIVLPYVPPARVRRNVAAHGIVTAGGFAPVAFTDQIIRRHRFCGGRATDDWRAADVAAVRTALDGVARWFRALGYVGAPAGVDGFLVDEPGGPRFVVLDPNARLSATMGPWSALAVLAERAGRPFRWQYEGVRMLGTTLSVERLRRVLGDDFLSPAAVARGGILPTTLATQRRLGPLGDCHLWALLLGHDAEHVAHLRRRLRSVALIAR